MDVVLVEAYLLDDHAVLLCHCKEDFLATTPDLLYAEDPVAVLGLEADMQLQPAYARAVANGLIHKNTSQIYMQKRNYTKRNLFYRGLDSPLLFIIIGTVYPLVR